MCVSGLCGQCTDNEFELRDRSGVNQYGQNHWEDVVGDSFSVFNKDFPNDQGWVARNNERVNIECENNTQYQHRPRKINIINVEKI